MQRFLQPKPTTALTVPFLSMNGRAPEICQRPQATMLMARPSMQLNMLPSAKPSLLKPNVNRNAIGTPDP